MGVGVGGGGGAWRGKGRPHEFMNLFYLLKFILHMRTFYFLQLHVSGTHLSRNCMETF